MDEYVHPASSHGRAAPALVQLWLGQISIKGHVPKDVEILLHIPLTDYTDYAEILLAKRVICCQENSGLDTDYLGARVAQ